MFEILFKMKAVLLLAAFPVELLALWVVAKSVRALRDGVRGRWSIPTALCLLHGMPLLFVVWRWASGTLFYGAPTDGKILAELIGTHVLFGGLLESAQFVLWALPVLLLLGLAAVTIPARAGRLRNVASAALLAVFVAASALVPWRMLRDATDITVDRVSRRMPLHSGRSLRVAVLSDIQLDEYTTVPRVRQYIDRVNAEHPDVVLIAGDEVTGSNGMTLVPALVAQLAMLRAPLGVYAVLGDHDVWAGKGTAKVPALLRASGITVLDDSVAHIAANGDTVAIAGLTNLSDLPATEASLAALLAGVPRGRTMLLTHQCSRALVRECAEKGVTLIAAGHTHGGQVAVFFFGLVISSAWASTRYVSGFYDDETFVYVCNGLGYSVLPFRHLATPSFGIIELHP